MATLYKCKSGFSCLLCLAVERNEAGKGGVGVARFSKVGWVWLHCTSVRVGLAACCVQQWTESKACHSSILHPFFSLRCCEISGSLLCCTLS